MSSLDSKTIYIFEDTLWVHEPVFGELHVLDSETDVLHYAGAHSETRTISFWLFDHADFTDLQDDMSDGDTVVLVDWLGDTTNVKIRDLQIAKALWDIKRSSTHYTVFQCRAKLQKA